MSGRTARPFYGRFAWAYDALVERPVAAECEAIAAILSGRGLAADARVLDAGCGTGRYAVELARRGYRVTGVDASRDLVEVARQRAGASTVTFSVADLLKLAAAPWDDAILCRGVLNDLVNDAARRDAFLAFGRVLRPGGTLVLDVRDWEAAVRRKTLEPIQVKTVEISHGTLTFRSETRLDHDTRQMRIAERHTLVASGVTITTDHDFVMRCWSREEMDARLYPDFVAVEHLDGYAATTPAGSTDRLVVVASRV